jgi:hypothetical protein
MNQHRHFFGHQATLRLVFTYGGVSGEVTYRRAGEGALLTRMFQIG